MSLEILNGDIVVDFVKDEEAFESWVKRRFEDLDKDGDGGLSFPEMMEELRCFRVFESDEEKKGPDEVAAFYSSLFSGLDVDKNGVLDLEEFKCGTKRIMLAMADGLGTFPFQIILEDGSYVKKALEWQSSHAPYQTHSLMT